MHMSATDEALWDSETLKQKDVLAAQQTEQHCAEHQSHDSHKA